MGTRLKKHYRKPDAPDAMCGRNGGECEFTDRRDDVTCGSCLRMLNRTDALHIKNPPAGDPFQLLEEMSITELAGMPKHIVSPDQLVDLLVLALVCVGCDRVTITRPIPNVGLMCRRCARRYRVQNRNRGHSPRQHITRSGRRALGSRNGRREFTKAKKHRNLPGNIHFRAQPAVLFTTQS
jgi:hypothetical protein